MNIRTLGWVLGAACLVTGGGFAIVACSSSTSPGSAGDTADSGGSNPDTGASSMPDTGSGGGNDAGMGSDCESAPHLHLGDGGSLFCPFGPDSGDLNCPTGSTICCIGGEISKGNYAVSQCGTAGQTCPNPLPDGGKYPARPVECEETVDCPSGNVCCATGGVPAETSCSFYRESPGLTAATCTMGTSCPAGQFQICESDIECGSGHTCQPFRTVGMELGFCQ